MKKYLITLVVTLSLFCLPIASFQPDSPLSLSFVKDAEAIIGLPFTPLSVAGVARRSMYREAAVAETAAATNAAAANAAAAQASAANAAAAAAAAEQAAASLPVGTMVPSLPPGCQSMVIGGVNYFQCGSIYYRAGFQGNNVVYIVSQP